MSEKGNPSCIFLYGHVSKGTIVELPVSVGGPQRESFAILSIFKLFIVYVIVIINSAIAGIRFGPAKLRGLKDFVLHQDLLVCYSQ